MDNRKYDRSKDCISIGQFVHQYLGINDENLNCSNLKHCGLKSFASPMIIGISNNYADKNPDLVKNGTLLIVLDCKQNRGTYFNPLKLQELLEKDLVEEEIKELEKIGTNNFEEIKDYYLKYSDAIYRQSQLQEFYCLLEELHKEKNIEEIKRQQAMFDQLEKGRKR